MTQFQPQFILCNALYFETKSFFWVESQTSLNFSLQWTLQSSCPSLLVTLVIDLQIWIQLYLWSSGQVLWCQPASKHPHLLKVPLNEHQFGHLEMMAVSMVITNSGIPKWEIQVAEKKNCWKPPIGYWEEEAQHIVVSWMMKKKQVKNYPPVFLTHALLLLKYCSQVLQLPQTQPKSPSFVVGTGEIWWLTLLLGRKGK